MSGGDPNSERQHWGDWITARLMGNYVTLTRASWQALADSMRPDAELRETIERIARRDADAR